jgi:hypothetical protein
MVVPFAASFAAWRWSGKIFCERCPRHKLFPRDWNERRQEVIVRFGSEEVARGPRTDEAVSGRGNQTMREAGFEELAARRWTSSMMRQLRKQVEQRDSIRMSENLVSLWAALAEAANDKERMTVAERIVELDGRWNSAELGYSELIAAARQIIRERVEGKEAGSPKASTST